MPSHPWKPNRSLAKPGTDIAFEPPHRVPDPHIGSMRSHPAQPLLANPRIKTAAATFSLSGAFPQVGSRAGAGFHQKDPYLASTALLKAVPHSEVRSLWINRRASAISISKKSTMPSFTLRAPKCVLDEIRLPSKLHRNRVLPRNVRPSDRTCTRVNIISTRHSRVANTYKIRLANRSTNRRDKLSERAREVHTCRSLPAHHQPQAHRALPLELNQGLQGR